MSYDFDLLTIGGGSGGVRASRWAAGFGAKVAICEQDLFGGTCVIRGCVPKKLMSIGAHFTEDIELMSAYGWGISQRTLDFKGFKERRQAEVLRISGVYQSMLETAGVHVLQGFARLLDPHTVEVNGRTYRSRYILIATGGTPYIPDIPGKEYVLSSNELFELEKVPSSLLIVGGGYIGVEFAGIFHGYGAKIQQIYRQPHLLRGFDKDVVTALEKEMMRKGIDLVANQSVIKVEKAQQELVLTAASGQTYRAEKILFATGRKPNTQHLNLEAVGVKTKSSGAIMVDKFYQTSVPSIYAVGDVTDRMNLTPVALAEAMVVAENLFLQPTAQGAGEARRRRQMSYEFIPTAVFSQPPLATVGWTEQQAIEEKLNIRVYKSDFRSLKQTLAGSQQRTFMKLIVDKNTEQVIGCHMMGEEAAEIMQGFAVALKAGATKAHFDQTVGIHPTVAEEFVTMRKSEVEK